MKSRLSLADRSGLEAAHGRATRGVDERSFGLAVERHAGPGEANNDQVAHEKGYNAFLRLLKIGTIVSAIVTAVVVYILAS